MFAKKEPTALRANLEYFMEKFDRPWSCVKSLAQPCAEVLRGGLAHTLKWPEVPEDSSDFDDSWTELIVMMRSIV